MRRRVSLEGLGKAGREEPGRGRGEREEISSSAFPSLYNPLKRQDKQGLGRSSNPFPMAYCVAVLPARLLGV